MNFLEERILKEGRVYPGNILKVDSFLNHQIDIELIDRIGEAFYEKYKDKGITRILTIEASGIAIACSAARFFKVPILFAKKAKSLNLGNDLYVSKVKSYTFGKEYDITLSKRYLNKGDRILLVDDFLAIGNALHGLIDICSQAGAEVEGICICIEKGFQDGGKILRDEGYDVTSLAIVSEMTDDGKISFKDQTA
ncbi:MAG: xanthine phosphoribosyltransferase [Lachnospiraceae bacterium]|nr:xanthine phosphoribosyltransferase [Lachnospiraceae bacterium]